jgi:hypothetical protein
MKRILPFVFIVLIGCSKESIKPEPISDGVVNYTIDGDSIQIIDSASRSVAKWSYFPSVINRSINHYHFFRH